jgi:hypothetical protein
MLAAIRWSNSTIKAPNELEIRPICASVEGNSRLFAYLAGNA